jgi:hypothetical protein
MLIAACILPPAGYVMGGSASSGTSFNTASFRKLSSADKLSIVFSVVEARDQLLQNFDYSLEETTTNHRITDGRERHVAHCTYEMRRLGGTLWMQYVPTNVDTGAIKSDSVCNWDGTVARAVAIPPYEGAPFPQCTITDFESQSFASRTFNELLGIRLAISPSESPSLLAWLRERSEQHDQIEVSTERLDNADMVLLKTGFLGRHWSFWFDPARGFMVVRRFYQVGETRNRSTFTVLSSESISSVWVPKRAVRHQELEDYPETSEIEYNVHYFKIGTVRHADVAVDFPPNSRVMDGVHKIEYQMQPDGKIKLLPLADVGTHMLHMPPQKNIVAAVDANTPSMYTKQPLVLATHPLTRAPNHGRRAIYIVASLLIVAAAVVVVMVRRRAPGRRQT